MTISSPQFLTACQARAARAMLSWSVRQLAEASGISGSSIRRLEQGFGPPENVTLDLRARMHAYLEGQGFRFVWDEGKPGLCWKNYPGPRSNSEQTL